MYVPNTDAVQLQNPLVQDCVSSFKQPDYQFATKRKHLQEIQPSDSDPKCRRFAVPLTLTEISDCCKPCIPKNTQSNTSWGVRVFSEWVKARNCSASSAEGKCWSQKCTQPH